MQPGMESSVLYWEYQQSCKSKVLNNNNKEKENKYDFFPF